MVRIIAQIALLAWWYPDTYEINRMFPNLAHLFSGWEQDVVVMCVCPALCQGNAVGGGQRTGVDGILHVLSDDSSSLTTAHGMPWQRAGQAGIRRDPVPIPQRDDRGWETFG